MFSSTSLDQGNETYDTMEELKEELDFLRYFYSVAGDSMGPADADIYNYIKQDYTRTYEREVPKAYREEY